MMNAKIVLAVLLVLFVLVSGCVTQTTDNGTDGVDGTGSGADSSGDGSSDTGSEDSMTPPALPA